MKDSEGTQKTLGDGGEEGTAPNAKPNNTSFMPNSMRVKRPGMIAKAKPKPKVASTGGGDPDADVEVVARPAPTPAPVAAALPLGECRSVDGYARLNLIAESQHGIVYRARNKETGQIVALKKFKTRKEPDGFPITFLREINILFTIKHPNIITADEVVFSGAGEELSWFLVMEFVDHDLKDLITTMDRPFLEGEVTHAALSDLQFKYHHVMIQFSPPLGEAFHATNVAGCGCSA